MPMFVERPDISVRLADEQDLPGLMKLLSDCIRKMRSIGLDQWDEIYPNEQMMRADVLGQHLYVFVASDQIVASWVLNTQQEPEYAAVAWQSPLSIVAVVHRLMVNPDYEGNGFASAAMRSAEVEAVRRGYTAIRLDAFSLNQRALCLYRRLGYVDVGAVKFRKGLFRCFEKNLQA